MCATQHSTQFLDAGAEDAFAPLPGSFPNWRFLPGKATKFSRVRKQGDALLFPRQLIRPAFEKGGFMYTRPNILLLSNDESERRSLEQVIGGYATLVFADRLTAIDQLLQKGRYDACICSWIFQEGIWKDALMDLQRHHPDLPVIVLSRTGGEREWLEVLQAGAFDLLAAPFRPGVVRALLEQAVSSHEAVTAGMHRTVELAAKAG